MNNKKYNKDFVRLLGLLQTIRGEQGKPLTGKQGLQSERLLWIMDKRNIQSSTTRNQLMLRTAQAYDLKTIQWTNMTSG